MPTPDEQPAPVAAPHSSDADVGRNARVIGAITLVSRVLGLIRESRAAEAFGASAVWSAFTFAFSIPNLFRRLFGEGALSAAFIPLYSQSQQGTGASDREASKQFASASVNLLLLILLVLTIVGEMLLLGLLMLVSRPDYVLGLRLTMVMLPYVMLVCGAAFCGAILQVHQRFAVTAATSLVLNAFLIAAIYLAGSRLDLTTESGKEQGVVWLAIAVLIAGVVQLLMLIPSLRAVGFRFDVRANLKSPLVRKMLILSVPVAMGAGVLQISTLLDKSIAFFLAGGDGRTHFQLLGASIRYPMEEGAAARLNWAQFMYQFPLGVFAIALATAIFPKLARSVESNSSAGTSVGSGVSTGVSPGASEEFKRVLCRGIESSLFIGIPATLGMMLVAMPAVRLLFERGAFTAHDTYLTAVSTAIYSAAIWAFSLQQILNRAYYALHDTRTPLVWGVWNLLINLAVEIPLIWTGLGESGMAVGTLVAFTVQAIAMTWILSNRLGGLGLSSVALPVGKMLIATAVMTLACLAARYIPLDAIAPAKLRQACELALVIAVGGVVYFAACAVMGVRPLRGSR